MAGSHNSTFALSFRLWPFSAPKDKVSAAAVDHGPPQPHAGSKAPRQHGMTGKDTNLRCHKVSTGAMSLPRHGVSKWASYLEPEDLDIDEVIACRSRAGPRKQVYLIWSIQGSRFAGLASRGVRLGTPHRERKASVWIADFLHPSLSVLLTPLSLFCFPSPSSWILLHPPSPAVSFGGRIVALVLVEGS